MSELAPEAASDGGPSSVVRALMTGLVDYAGLFPPTALAMDEAVRRYAEYAGGPHAWALGRFVVPAARLDEFERHARDHAGSTRRWRASALVGPDAQADLDRIHKFNDENWLRAVVDSVELKLADMDDPASTLGQFEPEIERYVEVDLAGDVGPRLDRVKAAGARAKARTGGVVPEAIPPVFDVARFVVACAERDLAFKATAGLHHPFRAEQNLTYAPDSPRATTHGFVNVFFAAAFARAGAGLETVERILGETNPGAFVLDAEARWAERRIASDALAAARRDFAFSFGSCSFEEPIADLQALHLL